jgi:hypothetical protein
MATTLSLPAELVALIKPEAERRARDVEAVAIELLKERFSPTREALLGEYREVCASHASITNFRAKLLALLPIASGAALGVLAFDACPWP